MNIWKKTHILGLGFTIYFGPFLHGQKKAEGTRKIQEKITKSSSLMLPAKKIESLQANLFQHEAVKLNFKQTVYRSLRKKTMTSYGEAYFLKPNGFRWTLMQPKKDSWLYNGKDLFLVSEQSKEAIRYKSGANKEKELKQLVNMVINLKELLKRYELVESSQDKDNYYLELEPRKDIYYGDDIEKIQLKIYENTKTKEAVVEKLKLYFRGDNTSLFEFTKIAKEKADIKQVSPPPGIKIINAL